MKAETEGLQLSQEQRYMDVSMLHAQFSSAVTWFKNQTLGAKDLKLSSEPTPNGGSQFSVMTPFHTYYTLWEYHSAQ